MRIVPLLLLLIACGHPGNFQTIKRPGFETDVLFNLYNVVKEETENFYSDYDNAITVNTIYFLMHSNDTISMAVSTIINDTTHYEHPVNSKTLESVYHLMMDNDKELITVDTGFVDLANTKWAYGWNGKTAFELLSYSKSFGYLKFELKGLDTKEENLEMLRSMQIRFSEWH